MGHGIAEAFARGEYPVTVFEPNNAVRGQAIAAINQELGIFVEEEVISSEDVPRILDRIRFVTTLEEAAEERDYIIEAIPENLDMKKDLFAELSGLAPAECIFASNTSSLPLSEMIADIPPERQKRSMVCHWYNPGHIMPIAELSYFGNMDEATFEEVRTLYRSIGKQPVKVLKDIPGLIANRIQQAVAREVFYLMEIEAAEPEDIDRALTYGPAFRYATSGQLEIADFGGLDIWSIVGDNLLAVMDNRSGANPLLKEKIAEGKLGIKSGEGFFAYPPETIGETKSRFTKRLIHQLKASQYYISEDKEKV